MGAADKDAFELDVGGGGVVFVSEGVIMVMVVVVGCGRGEDEREVGV